MTKAKKWLHDKLGWGFPNENYGDGGHSQCKYCDLALCTDSTGDSFHLSTKWEKEL